MGVRQGHERTAHNRGARFIVKIISWALVAYLATVGLSELSWVTLQNQNIAGVASWPSVSTLVEQVVPGLSASSTANTIEGSIDLAAAAAVWFFFAR